ILRNISAMSRNSLTKPSNCTRTQHEHRSRSFDPRGARAEDGQGVGCWERWRVGTSCCAGKKRVACAFSNPAEQKKSHWTVPAPALPIFPDATERQSAPTELTVAGDRKFESCSLRQGVRANFMSSP